MSYRFYNFLFFLRIPFFLVSFCAYASQSSDSEKSQQQNVEQRVLAVMNQVSQDLQTDCYDRPVDQELDGIKSYQEILNRLKLLNTKKLRTFGYELITKLPEDQQKTYKDMRNVFAGIRKDLRPYRFENQVLRDNLREIRNNHKMLKQFLGDALNPISLAYEIETLIPVATAVLLSFQDKLQNAVDERKVKLGEHTQRIRRLSESLMADDDIQDIIQSSSVAQSINPTAPLPDYNPAFLVVHGQVVNDFVSGHDIQHK